MDGYFTLDWVAFGDCMNDPLGHRAVCVHFVDYKLSTSHDVTCLHSSALTAVSSFRTFRVSLT